MEAGSGLRWFVVVILYIVDSRLGGAALGGGNTHPDQRVYDAGILG